MAAQEYLIPGKSVIVNETENGNQYLIPGLGVILNERPAAVGGVTVPIMSHHYTKNIGAGR